MLGLAKTETKLKNNVQIINNLFISSYIQFFKTKIF